MTLLVNPDHLVNSRRLAMKQIMQTWLALGILHLVAVLQDKTAPNRWPAVWALGQIGSNAKAAVPALIGALKAGDERLRGLAANKLKKIDPEAARQAGSP